MSTPKTADEKPRRGWWPFGGSSSSDDEEAVREQGVTARKGRVTPGRRTTPEEEGGNVVTRTTGGLFGYIEGVQSEIKKVSWPTREETRRLSVIVLVTTVIASLVLGLIALLYSELFRLGLEQPMIFLGFFVVMLVIGFILYRRSNRSSTPTY